MMKDTYSPMMQHYLSVKEQYPDSILFYRLGDFYEMFFEDAKTVSRELNLVLTAKAAGKEKAAMCGVPYHSAMNYLSRLINKGYKVAICEQIGDPKAKGLVERKVTQVYTPGTFIDENETKDSNLLAMIVYQPLKSLIVLCDLMSGEIFYDWMESSMSMVEKRMKEFEVKEILINQTLPKKWENFFSRNWTLSRQNLEKKEMSQDLLQASINALKEYMQTILNKEIFHLQQPAPLNSSRYLILDYETKNHLEIVESHSKVRNAVSLWKFLDRCQNVMGSRKLKSWLEHPLMDIDEIISRQDVIEMLEGDFMLREKLIDVLSQMADLDRLVSRISLQSIKVQDLIRLRNTLKIAGELNEDLERFSYLPIASMELCEALTQKLDETVEDEISQEGRWIRPGFDPDLDRSFDLMQKASDKLLELEEEEKKRTGLALKIIYHRSYGYLIEIRNSQLKGENQIHFLEEKFGYHPKQSLTGSTRFTYEKLDQLQEEINQAKEEKEKREQEIFDSLSGILKEWISSLKSLSDALGTLDVLLALALTASERGYVRPVFNQAKKVEVREGRHPILETRLDSFISNDWIMDENTVMECITGPNMGGKSTFLKQNALLVILAQMGSFVPARYASLPVFDRIFTRIGASDDLLSGESTFMVEMLETNRALQFSSENSLLLLDEIGRGTSTYDGMALAQSIIEYIISTSKAKTLFSTHYHELTDLHDDYPEIENVYASVLEKDGHLDFQYRIVKGKSDRSYGIQVARLAGIPDWIIKRADRLLQDFEGQPKEENTLFFMDANPVQDEIIRSLRNIDPDELSPRQAQQILFDLCAKAEKS